MFVEPVCQTISREHPLGVSPPPAFDCPLHPNFRIAKICRNCPAKGQFLLCERCLHLKLDHSHQDHPLMLVDFEKYLEDCISSWSQIQTEEKDAKAMFSKLEEFMLEADEKEKVVESFVDNEIQAINEDFQTILLKLDEIRGNVLLTKEKFVRTLTEEVKELKKLKEELGTFAREGSPLFRRKSAGTLEETMRKLQGLCSSPEDQRKPDYVVDTLALLIKEFGHLELNFQLNYRKDYKACPRTPSDYQGNDIGKREASIQIMTIINEIRNKAKYPPKYKRFQNSNQEFENFLRAIDGINSEMKGLSEKLLLTQQEVTYKLTGENLPQKASFSSNNNAILLKSDQDSSRLPQGFDIATSIKTDHRKGITCLCVYDNQSFITGGNDALIKIWDLFTFKCSKNLKCETVPYCLITMVDSSDEKLLVSGHAQGYVAVFNTNFDLRFVFKQQESIISSLMSIDDRKTVFSASYDGTILILDVVDGQVYKKLTDHEASVNCMGYAKGINKWASGSDDGRILIWEIQSEVSKAQMESLKEKAPKFLEDENLDSIESDHFSEEEKVAVTEDKLDDEEGDQGSLVLNEEKAKPQKEEICDNVSDSASFKDVKAVGGINNGEEVKHIVFSQNNPRILLSTCYNLIKLWDIQTRSCLMRIGKHEKSINRLLIVEEKTIQKVIFNLPRSRAGSFTNTNMLNRGNSNLLELFSIDRLMILSFGADHMIRMWNGAKNCCVAESNDHIKEFSLKDSLENCIVMYNEKDDKVYFLSVGDKDTSINIWKLS